MQKRCFGPWSPALPALLTLAALGCSADPGSGSTRRGTSPITVAVDGNGKCTEPGPQACHCGDGTAAGTQTCNPDGSLSPCGCSSLAAAGGTGGAGGSSGSGAPAMLCAELAGMSGCMAQSYESQELPASILFVIDRSKSMDCNPPPVQDTASCEAMAETKDPSQPTRWDVTIDALKAAFAELRASKATASVGLTFFSNDDQCGVSSKPSVPVGPLTDSNLTTLTTLLDATRPSGGTPVIGSTILAYQHMHEEAGAGIECPGAECPCTAPPCGAFGNRYVVLITDGAESCAADASELGEWTSALLDTEAPKAVRANVRTFVVGSPGSEPARGFLSELAYAGGTARNGGQCQHDRTSTTGDCHFDMTTTTDFAADLANVLESISGAALGCQFSVPTRLDDASSANVNVQFTAGTGGAPQCMARDDSAACDAGANGWQFARLPDGSPNLTTVVLCGAACEMVEADPGARVDVLVGCQTLLLE